jgi:hypothetical protein
MILFVNVLITMSLSVLFLLFPPVVVAYHEGQDISISLDSAEFIPLGEEGNQVNVFANYTVNDPSLVNQKINSVMKVYATNGTLIKTSSSADGFIVNQTGSQSHVTTITNVTLQNVIAVVQYTDLAKTLSLSNPLQVDLNLTQVPAITETETETESEIAALP